MEGLGAEDEAVMATNCDATECKLAAVQLGYWRDEYVGLFARGGERRAPEINRGYYARVRAVELFVDQFLERCGNQCQIISLGCGFDTLFWRLKDSGRSVALFTEIDFPSVVAKKCHLIKRHRRLLERLGSEDGDGDVEIRAGDLHAPGYRLLGADLRCVPELVRKLEPSPLPALVLAECVLVYLEPSRAAALLRHLSATLPSAALLCYEQLNLADRFGEVMLRNLAARGCPLAGKEACLSSETACARMLAAGWERAACWDMETVWRALPADDRARAERLEMLDERELLQQLLQHYGVTLATRGALLADMGLPCGDHGEQGDPARR